MRGALPNLVIAGVTKAGTTSLYRYLGQHPDVALGDIKEIDHYAPLLYGDEPPPLAAYAAHFADAGDRAWRLEASPRYFTGGRRLASRLASDLDAPKILIALRDPVGRMWSSYTYKRSKDRLPSDMRFPGFVERCIDVADRGAERDPENAVFRTAATGRYADYLGEWLDEFGDDVRVVFFDDLAAAPAATTTAICAWAGLDPAPVSTFDFEVRNATAQPRSQALRRVALRWNVRLAAVADDESWVKRTMRSTYRRMNSANLDEEMSGEARERIYQYYAPTLPALRHMLVEERGYAVPDWVAP